MAKKGHHSKPKNAPKPKSTSLSSTAKLKTKSKKSSDNGMEDEVLQLDTQLNQIGLAVKKITGDGNCLFRSIADQFGVDHSKHHFYRTEIVQYMREHPDNFAPFIVDQTLEECCNAMQRDGTWGGNLELVACSLRFQCNVIIYQLNAPNFEITNFPKHSTKTLHLSYHMGEHYNSVIPLVNNEEILKQHGMIISTESSSENNSNNKKPVELSKKERIILQSTQCKDIEHIRQVLQDMEDDMDAAIEFLVEEQNLPNEEETEESPKLKESSNIKEDDLIQIMQATGIEDKEIIVAEWERCEHDVDTTIGNLLNSKFIEESLIQAIEKDNEGFREVKTKKKGGRNQHQQEHQIESKEGLYLTKKEKNRRKRQQEIQSFLETDSSNTEKKSSNNNSKSKELDDDDLEQIQQAIKQQVTIKI